MQTKFRNGREIHEIFEELPHSYRTECGRVTLDHFRHKISAKVTCLQCIEKIERKENKTCQSKG